MRALTLKPHWAHCVAHHGKRTENRSRPIPEGLVGAVVAIHAGRYPYHGMWGEVMEQNPSMPADLPLIEMREGRGDGELRASPRRMQCRAIVATARLVGCVKVGQTERGGFVIGPYPPPWSTPWGDPSAAWWWKLADVRVLPEVVPVRARQLGLWRLPEATVKQIEEVLHA